jgi:hypothetical protein
VRTCCAILVLCAAAALPADSGYRSVSVDTDGQLHIVTNSGKEILPPKLRDQIAFGDPRIAPDGRTAGWLALYPYPNPPGDTYVGDPLAGALVLYRGGRIIHTFSTDQVFWDWQFWDGGKHVAFSTGPTHGEASFCILRAVDSGKLIATWQVTGGEEPPAWAKDLRY